MTMHRLDQRAPLVLNGLVDIPPFSKSEKIAKSPVLQGPRCFSFERYAC